MTWPDNCYETHDPVYYPTPVSESPPQSSPNLSIRVPKLPKSPVGSPTSEAYATPEAEAEAYSPTSCTCSPSRKRGLESHLKKSKSEAESDEERLVQGIHYVTYHEALLPHELVDVKDALIKFGVYMAGRPLQMELTDKQLKVTSCGHSCILEAGKLGAQKLETNGTLYTKNRPDWLYAIVYGLTEQMFSEAFEYETNAHGDTGGPREVGAPIKRVDAQAYFLFYAFNLETFLGIELL